MKDFQRYILPDTATIKDALIALNNLSADIQTLFVVNNSYRMIGSLTDGDIRRGLIRGLQVTNNIKEIIQHEFKFIFEYDKDVSAVKEIRESDIELLPCLNENRQIVKVYNLKKLKSLLPVDAVLMAGGKGERLRPLTDKTPKPLLKVGEKAIIDYNVEALISYGIENINVTTNYLGEQIEAHYSKPVDGVRINCVKEPKYLGTIGSIKFVENFTNDMILVMNSDLFTNIDYEDFFLHFKEHKADMSVAVVPYSITVPYGIFDLDGRNIKGIKEKPTYNYYANAGIYLIKKEIINLIPNNVFYNATDLMEELIKINRKVIRFPLTGYWIDIGKYEDYKKAQDLVKHL
ncbi:MAG: nucleotidyltransferase family protein [Petrimonas sp.]|uniref:nucleotidyltransferase family protein n=1 Tax=Petrimonas sp. TaxID=2023866 RepID=UPI002B3B8236|nr:nucleotidyltransferase family protein [Petrimonas sp.]MEA5045646.1 nucleotidyltransferase family protein [Petrimonas sp.]